MAPGVVGVKSDAVAGLLAQRHLHRVVVGIHIVLPVANPEIVGIQDARRVGVGQGTSRIGFPPTHVATEAINHAGPYRHPAARDTVNILGAEELVARCTNI